MRRGTADGDQPGSAEDLIRSLTGRDQTTMVDLLRARAILHPDATFMSWRADGALHHWTYAEAWTETALMAAGWRGLGVRSGTRVASFLWNRPAAVWAWLGAAAAGATFIPINRHLRGALLSDQLLRAKPTFLVLELDGLDALGDVPYPHDCGLVFVDDAVPDDAVTLQSLRAGSPAAVDELDPQAIGFLTFTSGSTGRSKAVRLSNYNLIRSACAYASPAVLGLGAGDVLFGWNPLFHLGALIPLTIASGAECALYPSFSASAFWQQINDSGATYVEGFPIMLDYLLGRPPTPLERSHRLRTFFVAGHNSEVWARAADRFGIDISNVAYDMSETGLVLHNSPAVNAPHGSCGIAYPGWEVQLEGEHGSHIRGAGTGEMVIRPQLPGLMFDGYEDDAQATVEAWRDLWFHTGDWMERDAGGHYFLRGRLANRIRRRGENVSDEELVGLLRRYPEIDNVAVVPIAAPTGEHDIKVAYVPKTIPFDTAAFVSWCRAELPRFMMPRYFQAIEELPLLPSEKVDVVRLRENSDTAIDVESDYRFVSRAHVDAPDIPDDDRTGM